MHGNNSLKTWPSKWRSSDTWLPFWRSSTNPARFSARITRSPETLGSFGISAGDFQSCPERLALSWTLFWNAPGFEVELDRFAQVGARRFDVLALRRDIQLRTSGDVPSVFFCDERRKAISHRAMLTKDL